MREFIGVDVEELHKGIIREIGAKGFCIIECIAAYSNFDTREAIVSIETIASKLGISYTTAFREINSLVERGYITKQIIPTKVGLRPSFKILDERFQLLRIEDEEETYFPSFTEN